MKEKLTIGVTFFMSANLVRRGSYSNDGDFVIQHDKNEVGQGTISL